MAADDVTIGADVLASTRTVVCTTMDPVTDTVSVVVPLAGVFEKCTLMLFGAHATRIDPRSTIAAGTPKRRLLHVRSNDPLIGPNPCGASPRVDPSPRCPPRTSTPYPSASRPVLSGPVRDGTVGPSGQPAR